MPTNDTDYARPDPKELRRLALGALALNGSTMLALISAVTKELEGALYIPSKLIGLGLAFAVMAMVAIEAISVSVNLRVPQRRPQKASDCPECDKRALRRATGITVTILVVLTISILFWISGAVPFAIAVFPAP